MQEPLQYLPVEKWVDLQMVFESDLPRSLTGYNVLETQRRWMKQGIHYDFRVYCPYGDVWNGMVAIIKKPTLYEIIIQCPRDDTDKLEDALKRTKIINWKETKILPAAPDHILNCVKSISTYVNASITRTIPCLQFVLDKTSPPFVDISLQPGITFGLLTSEHVNLVDSVWPHRYPNSDWYFEKIISSKSGYGLFKENVMVACAFVFDFGALGHLYVNEEHRRKGHGELISKLLCNIILKEGRDVFAYAINTNVKSCNLFRKLGFRTTNDTCWILFNSEV